MNSNPAQYSLRSEEAGEAHLYLRFTVGATGAVPTTFSRLSAAIVSVTRVSAGLYKVVFDSFGVPGYAASNPAATSGANLGVSPLIDAQCEAWGHTGTPGTDATGHARVYADNMNNQDASGVPFVTFQFNVGATATDPATGDEVVAHFILKTERP